MKNTYNFLVQVWNLLLPLSLKVLWHKERDTHSFYSGFSICPSSHAAPVARKFVWPLRALKVDPSRLVSSSQLNYFFKIPQILRARFRCMTSFTSTGQSFSGIFILTSVNDTSSPRAHQHLCSSLHLINPWAEPKGSQPN